MSHKIKDAVQPDAWYQALPRPQYKELEQIESADPWFSVYKLETDLYAIYEPKNFQEVISYLMIGSDRALLLDTGMGIGDIKKVVDSLYSGELIVVNTHSHFDHIGGNHQFPLVHILNQESAIGRMKNGLPHEMVEQNIAGDSTVLPYPDGFIPELYHIERAILSRSKAGMYSTSGIRPYRLLRRRDILRTVSCCLMRRTSAFLQEIPIILRPYMHISTHRMG